MHPHRGFAWEDEEAMLGFIRAVSFATICIEGPRVAHAPVVPHGQDRLHFHLSRANAVVPTLDGARAVLSFLGPDAYISPDWYGSVDQVPTWNYVAVEAEGFVRALDETLYGETQEGKRKAVAAAAKARRKERRGERRTRRRR